MPLPAPVSAAAQRASGAVKSTGQTVALYGFLVLMVLVGVGFLIGALYLWLSAIGTPLQAALVMGVGFIGVALLAFAVLAYRGRERRRRRREALASTAMMASSLSFANTIVRTFSRSRGSLVVPGLILLGGWLLLGGRRNRD